MRKSKPSQLLCISIFFSSKPGAVLHYYTCISPGFPGSRFPLLDILRAFSTPISSWVVLLCTSLLFSFIPLSPGRGVKGLLAIAGGGPALPGSNSLDGNSIEELKARIKIGPPWLTRFERARVIGARALQISMGAPILVNPDELDSETRENPVLIAKLELERGVLPMTIIRYTRSGQVQPIPVSWLVELDRARPRIH